MRVLLSGSLAGSFVVLALLSACSDKKSFAGGTPAGAVAKTEDAAPYSDPVEDSVPSKPAKEPQVDFQDCETTDANVFVADLYSLPNGTGKLPKFDSLTAIKEICLKQIDITNRKFTDGFPGVESLKEWFALNFNFNLKVTKAGSYKFRIKSDDGSILLIDGMEVVNNDGQHSAKDAEKDIVLTAGSHKVNLQYFQGPADEIALELFWTPPGESESYIPTKYVTRTAY